MAIRSKKLFYSIAEVSELTGIEAHVLRFWESEISRLKPEKNNAGNRIYTDHDIRVVQLLKTLLWEKKYTLVAVNQLLNDRPLAEWFRELEPAPALTLRNQELRAIKTALQAVLDRIQRWDPTGGT